LDLLEGPRTDTPLHADIKRSLRCEIPRPACERRQCIDLLHQFVRRRFRSPRMTTSREHLPARIPQRVLRPRPSGRERRKRPSRPHIDIDIQKACRLEDLRLSTTLRARASRTSCRASMFASRSHDSNVCPTTRACTRGRRPAGAMRCWAAQLLQGTRAPLPLSRSGAPHLEQNSALENGICCNSVLPQAPQNWVPLILR